MTRRVYMELRTVLEPGTDAERELSGGNVHELDETTAAELVERGRASYVDETPAPVA